MEVLLQRLERVAQALPRSNKENSCDRENSENAQSKSTCRANKETAGSGEMAVLVGRLVAAERNIREGLAVAAALLRSKAHSNGGRLNISGKVKNQTRFAVGDTDDDAVALCECLPLPVTCTELKKRTRSECQICCRIRPTFRIQREDSVFAPVIHAGLSKYLAEVMDSLSQAKAAIAAVPGDEGASAQAAAVRCFNLALDLLWSVEPTNSLQFSQRTLQFVALCLKLSDASKLRLHYAERASSQLGAWTRLSSMSENDRKTARSYFDFMLERVPLVSPSSPRALFEQISTYAALASCSPADATVFCVRKWCAWLLPSEGFTVGRATKKLIAALHVCWIQLNSLQDSPVSVPVLSESFSDQVLEILSVVSAFEAFTFALGSRGVWRDGLPESPAFVIAAEQYLVTMLEAPRCDWALSLALRLGRVSLAMDRRRHWGLSAAVNEAIREARKCAKQTLFKWDGMDFSLSNSTQHTVARAYQSLVSIRSSLDTIRRRPEFQQFLTIRDLKQLGKVTQVELCETVADEMGLFLDVTRLGVRIESLLPSAVIHRTSFRSTLSLAMQAGAMSIVAAHALSAPPMSEIFAETELSGADVNVLKTVAQIASKYGNLFLTRFQQIGTEDLRLTAYVLLNLAVSCMVRLPYDVRSGLRLSAHCCALAKVCSTENTSGDTAIGQSFPAVLRFTEMIGPLDDDFGICVSTAVNLLAQHLSSVPDNPSHDSEPPFSAYLLPAELSNLAGQTEAAVQTRLQAFTVQKLKTWALELDALPKSKRPPKREYVASLCARLHALKSTTNFPSPRDQSCECCRQAISKIATALSARPSEDERLKILIEFVEVGREIPGFQDSRCHARAFVQEIMTLAASGASELQSECAFLGDMRCEADQLWYNALTSANKLTDDDAARATDLSLRAEIYIKSVETPCKGARSVVAYVHVACFIVEQSRSTILYENLARCAILSVTHWEASLHDVSTDIRKMFKNLHFIADTLLCVLSSIESDVVMRTNHVVFQACIRVLTLLDRIAAMEQDNPKNGALIAVIGALSREYLRKWNVSSKSKLGGHLPAADGTPLIARITCEIEAVRMDVEARTEGNSIVKTALKMLAREDLRWVDRVELLSIASIAALRDPTSLVPPPVRALYFARKAFTYVVARSDLPLSIDGRRDRSDSLRSFRAVVRCMQLCGSLYALCGIDSLAEAVFAKLYFTMQQMHLPVQYDLRSSLQAVRFYDNGCERDWLCENSLAFGDLFEHFGKPRTSSPAVSSPAVWFPLASSYSDAPLAIQEALTAKTAKKGGHHECDCAGKSAHARLTGVPWLTRDSTADCVSRGCDFVEFDTGAGSTIRNLRSLICLEQELKNASTVRSTLSHETVFVSLTADLSSLRIIRSDRQGMRISINVPLGRDRLESLKLRFRTILRHSSFGPSVEQDSVELTPLRRALSTPANSDKEATLPRLARARTTEAGEFSPAEFWAHRRRLDLDMTSVANDLQQLLGPSAVSLMLGRIICSNRESTELEASCESKAICAVLCGGMSLQEDSTEVCHRHCRSESPEAFQVACAWDAYPALTITERKRLISELPRVSEANDSFCTKQWEALCCERFETCSINDASHYILHRVKTEKRDRVFEPAPTLWQRETVVWCLDDLVQELPVESIPAHFGWPSTRIFCEDDSFTTTSNPSLKHVCVLLNPSGDSDLEKTEQRMLPVFHKLGWSDAADSDCVKSGDIITSKTFAKISSNKPFDFIAKYQSDVVVYCGHDFGQQCGLGYDAVLQSAHAPQIVFLFGCSSGALRGPRGVFAPGGVVQAWIARGVKAVIGMLWDVTSGELDLFSKKLLEVYFAGGVSLADAVSKARRVCRLPNMSGCAPVIYGAPVGYTEPHCSSIADALLDSDAGSDSDIRSDCD